MPCQKKLPQQWTCWKDRIKSLIYSMYYVEACDELAGPSTRHRNLNKQDRIKEMVLQRRAINTNASDLVCRESNSWPLVLKSNAILFINCQFMRRKNDIIMNLNCISFSYWVFEGIEWHIVKESPRILMRPSSTDLRLSLEETRNDKYNKYSRDWSQSQIKE